MRASRLPKVRDQLAWQLRHARTRGAFAGASADMVARHLDAAGLYWVAPDMAALAVAAGRRLEVARWSSADRPASCGLLVFDGGAGSAPASQVALDGDRPVPGELPVDAVTWGPMEGGCALALWTSRDRLERPDNPVDPEVTPPLVPMLGGWLPAGENVPLGADLPEQLALVPTVVAALAAAWLLMEQPLLAERRPVEVDRQVRRAYGRAGREAPEVTIVELRHRYRPTVPADEPGAQARYQHRWVVSGHWRDQPHGPGRALRRRIWIADHIKGPDGAPLLASERVNVWRR